MCSPFLVDGPFGPRSARVTFCSSLADRPSDLAGLAAPSPVPHGLRYRIGQGRWRRKKEEGNKNNGKEGKNKWNEQNKRRKEQKMKGKMIKSDQGPRTNIQWLLFSFIPSPFVFHSPPRLSCSPPMTVGEAKLSYSHTLAPRSVTVFLVAPIRSPDELMRSWVGSVGFSFCRSLCTPPFAGFSASFLHF